MACGIKSYRWRSRNRIRSAALMIFVCSYASCLSCFSCCYLFSVCFCLQLYISVFTLYSSFIRSSGSESLYVSIYFCSSMIYFLVASFWLRVRSTSCLMAFGYLPYRMARYSSYSLLSASSCLLLALILTSRYLMTLS